MFVQNQTGEAAAFIEQVGEVTAVQRTNRHADTPLVPTPMDRRWTFPKDFEVADLIDKQDRLRQIIDPTSPFATAQAASIGRAVDDEVIKQFLSSNKTGQDAETDVPLPVSQVIPDDGAGLTIEKLRIAREKFLDANVDLDREVVYAAITPRQQAQLLATTEITSADYNTVRALVSGQVDTFMGFTFKVSNRLLGASKYNGIIVPTPDIESAQFFTGMGMGLSIWDDIETRISERDDKSYATQVYCKSTFGATRLQEEKCIRIDTLKTV